MKIYITHEKNKIMTYNLPVIYYILYTNYSQYLCVHFISIFFISKTIINIDLTWLCEYQLRNILCNRQSNFPLTSLLMEVRSSAFRNTIEKAWQGSSFKRFHFNQRDTKINAHTYTGWGECALIISQRGVTKI